MTSIWSRARQLAEATPASRNRYVDFLRALSILFVITGHWLVVALHYRDGSLVAGELTAIQPGTQWLTWLFQVMPIFFIVGGYANAVSIESARQKGTEYAGWLAGRLHRLISPLLLLVMFWAALSAVLHFAGVSGPSLRLGSRAALIPTWFLAIYIMVVVLAPATYRAWRRWGFGSLAVLAALGAFGDATFFAAGLHWAGWGNYFWVWLAVHHLGYAWRDGRLGGPGYLLALAVASFAALVFLIFEGPYPFAMVGSPDSDLSNTTPPKITLLALGAAQFGLLLAAEQPMRRFLARVGPWAATVLVNSMIMTVYLWHLTVMVVVVALAWLAGGIGLGAEPASAAWWLSRPLWIAGLFATLLPVALALSPLERLGRPADRPPPPAARQVAGAILLCLGIALLALFGFGASPLPHLDIAAFLLVAIGALLLRIDLPRLRR